MCAILIKAKLMKRITSFAVYILLLALLPALAMASPVLKFEVRGVGGAMQQNVISRLSIERNDLGNNISAAAIQGFSEQSLQAVRDALAPYGYYKPHVESVVQHHGDVWVVIYTIQPGQPVRVKKVDIIITGAGADNEKIRRQVKMFPLKVGDVFNSVVYTAARDKLFDVVANQGYVKAVSPQSKVTVNVDTSSAVVSLSLNTNERYYFGKITFNDNEYSPEFMRRFDLFDEHEPFSSNKLLEYQEDLNNSRYFKQAIVIPDIDGAKDAMIPMQASVVPINARRYAFGLGYGTFTGVRFTAGMNLKRLTNTGHSLDAQLKISSVLSGVALKYSIPGKNPLTEQWVMGANYQKFVPKNGYSNSESLAFGYTRKMHHWSLATNMNYLWERYRVNDLPRRDSTLLYPNISLNYIKTDNIVQPSYGRSLNLMLQGASSDLLSSTSFLQGEVQGKLFMTPFSFAHIIVRGDIGYTVVNDLNDLPLSMRFFAGGMTTVRGYPDSSIGPGKYLGVASIEYRNHIAYDISGAVFYDVGTATNHIGGSSNQDGGQLNRGAGVGLVYESVVGPIKLYVARAISKDGQPYQVEISMGPEF